MLLVGDEWTYQSQVVVVVPVVCPRTRVATERAESKPKIALRENMSFVVRICATVPAYHMLFKVMLYTHLEPTTCACAASHDKRGSRPYVPEQEFHRWSDLRRTLS